LFPEIGLMINAIFFFIGNKRVKKQFKPGKFTSF
jgi:hypothetical protein